MSAAINHHVFNHYYHYGNTTTAITTFMLCLVDRAIRNYSRLHRVFKMNLWGHWSKLLQAPDIPVTQPLVAKD